MTHRVLIAPQLSAPGIDVKKVKEETGWNVVFGAVYAEDIPEYVKNNFQKTERMHLVEFNLKDRVEMATIYFVAISLILSIPLLILFPKPLSIHNPSNGAHDLLHVHNFPIFPSEIRLRKGCP